MANIVSKGDRIGAMAGALYANSVPGVKPAASVPENDGKTSVPGVRPAASVPNNAAMPVKVTPAPGVKAAAPVPENPGYVSSYHQAYGKRFQPGKVTSPGGMAMKVGYTAVAQPKSGNEPHTGQARRPSAPHESHFQRMQRQAKYLYPTTSK